MKNHSDHRTWDYKFKTGIALFFHQNQKHGEPDKRGKPVHLTHFDTAPKLHRLQGFRLTTFHLNIEKMLPFLTGMEKNEPFLNHFSCCPR
jgi:hypothetical protein